MTASSTSRMGISSRIGYARRHSPHFRLCPSSLENERFFAHRADQNVEQIVGNHGGDFTPFVHASKLEG